MGIALILLGLFLWFALAFNGGVGEPFVNYSFFASALFMVFAGATRFTKSELKASRYLGAAALLSYIPMIWQRFNFTLGTDWGGFIFDTAIIVLLLVHIVSKPNHTRQINCDRFSRCAPYTSRYLQRYASKATK